MKTNLRIEQWIEILAIALLSLGCFVVIRPFIASLLWAGILCFSTWPFFLRVQKICGNRRRLSALIMTLLLAFVMVLPFALVGLSLADNLSDIGGLLARLGSMPLPAPPPWLQAIPLVGPLMADHWQDFFGSAGTAMEFAKDLLSRNEAWLFKAGINLGLGVLQLSLSVLIAFFFYRDGAQLSKWIAGALRRLVGEQAIQVTQAVGGTIKGVFYGILGTALAQGVLAGVGFKLAGLPSPMLLGFLTFCLSIIQAGPPLIWIPATLWLLLSDDIGHGVFMGAWGMIIISGIDNLLRPYLISRGANLPLVVILLGVMGGLLAFGFMGIFLGPVLLVVGGVLLRLWIAKERTKEEA